jgi:MFS family permease
MNKRQFAALSVSNFVPSVLGAGALPLLPVYAARLGAPPAITGYYLAFAYLAVVAGTMVGGWLSDRCRCSPMRDTGQSCRRVLLALAGALAVPATWAMGRVGSVWGLCLVTAAVWFLGGAGMAVTSILVNLSADESERGKVHGLMSLAAGVGSLVGSLLSGFLVDCYGFTTMFALLSLVAVLWPLAALFLRDQRAPQAEDKPNSVAQGGRLGKGFYLLSAASLVVAIAGFVGMMGRSMSMSALGYPATAISSTMALSSALTLPLPLLIGWLSDRLGRKRFLVIGYLIAAVGLTVLSRSSALWHFAVAVILTGLSGSIRGVVAPALADDLIPRESLGRGLGLFSSTGWVGAIVGFAGTGQAVQHLGLTTTLICGAVLPLVALFLLVPVGRTQRIAAERVAAAA